MGKDKKDKAVVNDLNSPEAIQLRIAKMTRDLVAQEQYSRTYDDLNDSEKKNVQKLLKGSGKTDKALKAKGVKDAFAYGIGSEPNARNVPILARPQAIAILNAVARVTGRTQTCVMRQVIEEMPTQYAWTDKDGNAQVGFEVIETDFYMTKDGVDYDIRENIQGVYDISVKKAN